MGAPTSPLPCFFEAFQTQLVPEIITDCFCFEKSHATDEQQNSPSKLAAGVMLRARETALSPSRRRDLQMPNSMEVLSAFQGRDADRKWVLVLIVD